MDPSPPSSSALRAYLTGPTAVGKSEVALLLAERRGWEILSLDSRQIYRRLDVGTAKPEAEARRRVPHHLVDLFEPEDSVSAGRFRVSFLKAVQDLEARGRGGLAVGGSGLYWEACALGLHPLPAASPEVRMRHARILETEGPASLHRRLSALDPETAGRLSPRDLQRVSRALEVHELTGVPLSRHLEGAREGGGTKAQLPVVALMRSREDLYRRIEERCHRMLEAGLVEELRGLLAAGVPPEAPGLRTVGYREFLPLFLKGIPLQTCMESFLRNSRRYAKRQETWLRHRLSDRREILLDAEEPIERTVARVEAALGA